METNSTSLVTVLSSAHGRQRRLERNIGKRDLQAAIKYGTREPGHPCPRTGERRWRYTFADVVYVTDEEGRKEITSWPAPGCGIDVEKVLITPEMRANHKEALGSIAKKANWTSHTVVVVDQSGSMRKTDVADGVMRADAVWVALALDFVGQQLRVGEAEAATDVFSLIGMRGHGEVLLHQRPVDWILYNDLIDLLRVSTPSGPGNYVPALDKAENLLMSNQCGSCALLLLFLSDGRPGDNVAGGSALTHWQAACCVKALASRFRRRLTVGAIAFGPPGEEFGTLQAIAEASKECGSDGHFIAAPLCAHALSKAFTSLSSTLSNTRTELTDVNGSHQRKVRDVPREPSGALDDEMLTESWFLYVRPITITRWGPQGWESEPLERMRVAMKKYVFGVGAERLVRKFRLVNENGAFVGPKLVAKETQFIGDLSNGDLKAFHSIFCKTQTQAQMLATKFNDAVSSLPGTAWSAAQIRFLECSVYMVHDQNLGRIGLLVEKMLDPQRYKKWKSKKGSVSSQADLESAAMPTDANFGSASSNHNSNSNSNSSNSNNNNSSNNDDQDGDGSADLRPIDNNSNNNSSNNNNSNVQFDLADVPQAFSHFTYRHTNRKMLVCDLQGALDSSKYPPVFELTDPVIHYSSVTGRAQVYGRRDKGRAGINEFFSTHQCSELCRQLNRRFLPPSRGQPLYIHASLSQSNNNKNFNNKD
ncbi:unnamed protein product [Polarella glacialis]|uniref:Alpha-type protein kinase domain-containing protein n=1 Tax=Polarella glacialis TaxID=89957 RepID=A0A813IMI0_POLGL|nr:unnamed protein product [Polarella glacialis]